MTRPCHGTDHGYICHLAQLCRHVTPEATTSDAMKCEHLGFEHFMSHPDTTFGAISRARSDAERRGPPEVVVALKREYARMTKPRAEDAPNMALQAAGKNMELFA